MVKLLSTFQRFEIMCLWRTREEYPFVLNIEDIEDMKKVFRFVTLSYDKNNYYVIIQSLPWGRYSKRRDESGHRLPAFLDYVSCEEHFILAINRLMYRVREQLKTIYDFYVSPVPRDFNVLKEVIKHRLSAWLKKYREGKKMTDAEIDKVKKFLSICNELGIKNDVDEFLKIFEKDPYHPLYRTFIAKWFGNDKKTAKFINNLFFDIDFVDKPIDVKYAEKFCKMFIEDFQAMLDKVCNLPIEKINQCFKKFVQRTTLKYKEIPSVVYEVLKNMKFLCVYTGGGVHIMMNLGKAIDVSSYDYIHVRDFVTLVIDSLNIKLSREGFKCLIDPNIDPRLSSVRIPNMINTKYSMKTSLLNIC